MTDSLRNSVLPFEMEIKKLRNENINLQLKFEETLKKKENELNNKQSLLSKLNEILKQKDEKIDQMEINMGNDNNIKLIYDLEDKLEKAENRINQLERENYFNSVTPKNGIQKLSRLNQSRQSLRSIDQYNLIKQLTSSNQNENNKPKKIPESFANFENILKRKKDELKEKFEEIDEQMTLDVFNDTENDLNNEIKKTKIVKRQEDRKENYEFFNKTIESLQDIICKGEEMSKTNEDKLMKFSEENNILIERVDELKLEIIQKEDMYGDLIVTIDDYKIEMEKLKNNIYDLENQKKVLQRSLEEVQNKKRKSNSNLSDIQSMVLQLKSKNSVLSENLDKANSKLKNEKRIYEEKINDLNLNLEKKKKDIENLENDLKRQNSKNTELIKMISDNKKKNLEKEGDMLNNMKERELYFENQFQELNKKIKELENKKDLKGLNIKLPENEENNILELDELSIDENNLNISKEIQPDITSDSEEDEFIVRESLNIPYNKRNSIEIRPSIFGVDQLKNGLNLQNQLDFNKKEQELEQAKKNILRYLDILEDKKKEINDLKNEIKKKMENYIDKEIHNSEVNLLKMDIKHLKEGEITNKKIFDKKLKTLEEEYEEMTKDYMEAKINYSTVCAEKDSEMIRFNRQHKKLKFQIKLYEDQIKNFNDKYKQK